MPRVTRVNKAQKKQGQCSKCGAKIKVGDSYVWWANRIGRSSIRKVRCGKKECYPRASDLTTSDKLSQVYAAQEQLEDVIQKAGCISEIAEALRDCASTANDVAQEYRDSVDNMPENLQNGSQADEMNQKADDLESWAQDLESAADEVEDCEEEEEEGESTEGEGEEVESGFDQAVRIAEDVCAGQPL